MCYPCECNQNGSGTLEIFFVPAWAVRILSYEFAAERSRKQSEELTTERKKADVNP